MKKILILSPFIIISMLYAEGVELIGHPAPDFTLQDEQGISHHLADYLGQDVVVYFYPKDDTPGCIKEACGIRDSFGIFELKNIKVFGISYDSGKSHLKFKQKYDLPFTLLSDIDKSVAKRYNSAGFLVPKRRTFLIDKAGDIFKEYQSVDVTTHAKEILQEFDLHSEKLEPVSKDTD